MKDLTKKQKTFLNKYTKRTWTYNPDTGLVDVDGNFKCRDRNITTLLGIKFGKVSGDFDCNGNELTSLEGAPKEVGGEFDCAVNRLTSLKGAPKKVGGDFCCHCNALTSLKGAPKKVGGDFHCWHNSLTSLEGAPKKVGGDIILCPFDNVIISGKDCESFDNGLTDIVRLMDLGLL